MAKIITLTENLRKMLIQNHFQVRKAKIITLNISKEIITSNQLLSQSRQKTITLKINCYFESTFKPKLAKMVTLNGKLLLWIYFQGGLLLLIQSIQIFELFLYVSCILINIPKPPNLGRKLGLSFEISSQMSIPFFQ